MSAELERVNWSGWLGRWGAGITCKWGIHPVRRFRQFSQWSGGGCFYNRPVCGGITGAGGLNRQRLHVHTNQPVICNPITVVWVVAWGLRLPCMWHGTSNCSVIRVNWAIVVPAGNEPASQRGKVRAAVWAGAMWAGVRRAVANNGNVVTVWAV